VFSLPQSWKVTTRRRYFVKVQDYARILPAEVFDSERKRSTKYRRWTTNLQLASFGIRQKVDVLYSLSQFVRTLLVRA